MSDYLQQTSPESCQSIRKEQIFKLIVFNENVVKKRQLCEKFEKYLEGSIDFRKIWNIFDISRNFWKRLFESIQTCHIEEINAWNQFLCKDTLLKSILSVKFDELRELNLGMNSISSLQLFVKLQAPNLQELNLNQNNICSIRPLVKCWFPQLKKLFICDNLITEFKLEQMKAPKLTEIHLSKKQNATHRFLIQIIAQRQNRGKIYLNGSSGLVKLETNNLIKAKFSKNNLNPEGVHSQAFYKYGNLIELLF